MMGSNGFGPGNAVHGNDEHDAASSRGGDP